MNRTAANVRAAFGKNGGNMGNRSGSVSYLLTTKELLCLRGDDADSIFELLLEADVDVE